VSRSGFLMILAATSILMWSSPHVKAQTGSRSETTKVFWSRNDLIKYLTSQAIGKETVEKIWRSLCDEYPSQHLGSISGDVPVLTGSQIREVVRLGTEAASENSSAYVARDFAAKKGSSQTLTEVKTKAADDTPTPPPIPKPVQIKIRQSYTDLLKDEDPTLGVGATSPTGGIGSPKGDVNGASLSYTHSHKDTWAAEGAIILSILGDPGLDPYSRFAAGPYGFVASASINKISSNDKTIKDPDSLLFRAGWLQTLFANCGREYYPEIDILGSFTYATDTEFRLSIPGGGLNIEPKFVWVHGEILGGHEDGLGYRFNRWPISGGNPDYPRTFNIGYQLRTWLHLEGGVFEHQASKSLVPEGDFFRMGPVIQATIFLPRLLYGVSLTAEYDFLPSVFGPVGRTYYFTTGAEFTLWPKNDRSPYEKDDRDSIAKLQKVSLKVSYENGGLDFTKQLVDDLKVGLGITF
jgi:hypothetical protein